MAEKRITFELMDQVNLSIKTSHSVIEYCEKCGRESSHLGISVSSSILGLSETAVFRLTESAEIHSRESAGGALLICSVSIMDFGSKLLSRLGD